jgi:hypothetical protein
VAEIVGIAPAIPANAKLADRIFFKEHRDRRLRIRLPFAGEYTNEFRGFGMHQEDRRRVIVARIPANMSKRHNVDFMRIPFLLFADETVEDRDDILAPILDKMMREAANG